MFDAAPLLTPVLEFKRRAEVRPLDYMRWLPAQVAYLSSTHPRTLLRTGNQSQGKTTAGLADCIWRCVGFHPFKAVPPPPVEIWIITASWSQSVAIQKKLWALVPKDLLHPATEFDPIRGFRGKNPACRFLCGSIIRIKTAGQGGLNLSSDTIDHALFDEPPPSPRIYGEVQKRVQRAGGSLGMTLTPVNAPVDWIREAVDGGQILDLHFRLTPENLMFAGTTEAIRTKDGTPCDAAWIERIEGEGLSYEVPVVVHGEWEMKASGRVFEGFREDLHVVPNLLQSDVMPSDGLLEICVGIDYGEEKLRTCGACIYVDDSGEYPRVFVVGAYVPQAASTLEMDARGLLTMLATNGDRWADVDFAWGDKKYTDAKGYNTKKSNNQMLEAIGKLLGLDGDPRPIIKGAKRGPGAGRGSVHRGIRWLHDCMIRPGGFYVDASLGWVSEAFLRWDGDERSKYKDVLDAIRYALRHRIIPQRRAAPRRVYRKF